MAELNYHKLHNEFKEIFKKIRDYDRIVIYRHTAPDYDAFGSQMGLATWIKENFPEKEVHFVGEANPRWCPELYPQPETLATSWYDQPFLAISVDTPSLARLSGIGFDKAAYAIKIDHHPNDEPFGAMNVVYPDIVACAELIALFTMAQSHKFALSPLAAKYLYSGIVGDSGRFLYAGTDAATLRIAADLIQIGANVNELYDLMYARTMADIETQKFVLNNTKFTTGGIAYYVITDADLRRLKISVAEGKKFVNQFRNVEGITATVSATQDIENDCFRVSLRSDGKPVNAVADKYSGGGHKFAAGATLNSLDELPWLLKDLDAVPPEQK